MFNYYGQQQFQNPYFERLQAMSQPPTCQITRVSGKNGADAFQMPPNSSILLLDETQPVVWLKTTDGAGYATSTPYQIAPYQAEEKPDYKTLEQRISKLEETVKNAKSDVTEAKQSKRSKSDE